MAKISQLVGRAFETAIDGKLELLRQLGVVGWYEKQQPEWFYNRKLRIWMRGEPSGADFHGFVGKRWKGAAFALEAKSTGPEDDGDGALILEKRVSDKQRAHLEAAWGTSGLAYLAAQFRRPAAPWLTVVIPWGHVPWEKARTRHHLHPEAAERWRLPMDRHLFEHLLPQDGKRSALEDLAAAVEE